MGVALVNWLQGENVLHLLAWREISPTVKRPLRRLWGESAAWSVDCTGRRREVTDARVGLIFWYGLGHDHGIQHGQFPALLS